MDETMKPVRIPPEMSIYAEQHDIFDLVQVTTCFNGGPTSPDTRHHFVCGLYMRLILKLLQSEHLQVLSSL